MIVTYLEFILTNPNTDILKFLDIQKRKLL